MHAPVTFSLDADAVGWLMFDTPGARANVLNPPTLAALAQALQDAADSTAKALVLISAKERIFIAGADLNWIADLSDAGAATAVSRSGQSLFQKINDLPIPVVCAIHGACAGGGFEVALACHWRLASDASVTQVGLPEVSIGAIPGWGGCVRLPRLLGVTAALNHILRAQLLSAKDALTASLVDEVVPAGELKSRAKSVALRLAAEPQAARPAPLPPSPDFLPTLRRTTLQKHQDHQPAPLAVIDVVSQSFGLDLAAAFDIEARTFGKIIVGDVCKNMIGAFFLRDAAKKRTLDGWYPTVSGQLPPIRRIGVVGAGVMGSGIAQWIASRGFEVVLSDTQPEQLARGLEVVRTLFADAVRRGRLTAAAADAALGRLTTTSTGESYAGCDLVIEAIVENVTAKQQLFRELASRVGPDTLLVSNTSAIPIEEIAGQVPRPERTLGLHFFNPVSRMPLVELILGRHTSAASAARLLAFTHALGKSPVITRSSPGFLMTRVLFFYLNAAVKLWEQGVPTAQLDGALREFGWPMGPLRLIDEVGVDVSDFIFQELAGYFPTSFTATTTCARFLAAGLPGRKNGTGAGFYTYQPDGETVNTAVPQAAMTGVVTSLPNAAAISDHLMDVMIAEARLCLDEGVVRSPDDIDFALLTGAGFPAFRGGLMRHARAMGKYP